MFFSLTDVSPISGFHTEIRPREINLIPFIGVAEILRGGVDYYSLTNLAGNILLFSPLGFFAPVLCGFYDRFAYFYR